MGRGLDYPGTNTPKNGSNEGAVFVHLGDDIGVEHSWRLGASLHQTTQTDALSTAFPDLLNTRFMGSFTRLARNTKRTMKKINIKQEPR